MIASYFPNWIYSNTSKICDAIIEKTGAYSFMKIYSLEWQKFITSINRTSILNGNDAKDWNRPSLPTLDLNKDGRIIESFCFVAQPDSPV